MTLNMLQLWSSEGVTPIGRAMNMLLMVHALRPDRLLSAAHLLVGAVFGEQFMPQAEKVLNLQVRHLYF